jgi:hypothetical protein
LPQAVRANATIAAATSDLFIEISLVREVRTAATQLAGTHHPAIIRSLSKIAALRQRLFVRVNSP